MVNYSYVQVSCPICMLLHPFFYHIKVVMDSLFVSNTFKDGLNRGDSLRFLSVNNAFFYRVDNTLAESRKIIIGSNQLINFVKTLLII